MRKFAIAAALAVMLGAGPAAAHDYKIGSLQVVHPWARATPNGAKIGGGYLKVVNNGTEPDRLVGGTSAVADRFEIHEMSMEGGVMRMRPLAGGLVIAPGATVELKPGGLHLMFVNLKQPLKAGERVKGTLVFEKAGTVEVEYKVEPMGGPAAHSGH